MTQAPNATTPRRDTSRSANLALIWCAAFVGVVTFVLSFHGLDDYGRVRAGLDYLAPLAPLGVDGMTLVAIAATYLLRHAAIRLRMYAWLVFAVAVAASIAGNLSHANARHLHWDGMIGAAAWPVFLALASHLVIVTTRSLEGDADVTDVAVDATQVTATAVVETQPVASPVASTATSRVRQAPRKATPRRTPNHARGSDSDKRQAARQMYEDGLGYAEIALKLGISKRSAERYTAPLRQAASTPSPDDQERVS